jgi:hypothetical protein
MCAVGIDPGSTHRVYPPPPKGSLFDTIEPERKSRSNSIASAEPTRMYHPAFLGSFGWELQQLISQFVVADVALCHIF